MEERISNDELKNRLTATHIEQVNKMMPSPSERAEIVWKEIQKASTVSYISNWDVICFAVEILGKFSDEFPWLREAAKQINGLVYKAHYLNFDRIRQHETEVMKIDPPKIDDFIGKEVTMEIPKMTGE